MEHFKKLDCGCYIGFDVNHKPMWGKQCSLHSASEAMYEALQSMVEKYGFEASRKNREVARAKLALARARAK